MEKYYTPAEISEILKIRPDAVRRKMHAGEFGSTVNINNRKHLITESGLQAYIDGHTGASYHPRKKGRKPTPPRPGMITGRI